MDQSIIATVGVVVIKKDDPEAVCLVKHLALANHITGVYGLPSGKIEKNESPVDAAVRELHEESGLLSAPKHMVFLKQYYAKIQQKDGMKRMTWDVYHCCSYQGELKESEETSPIWVKKINLSKITNFLPNVLEAIAQVR